MKIRIVYEYFNSYMVRLKAKNPDDYLFPGIKFQFLHGTIKGYYNGTALTKLA